MTISQPPSFFQENWNGGIWGGGTCDMELRSSTVQHATKEERQKRTEKEEILKVLLVSKHT